MESVNYWVVDSGSSHHIMSKTCDMVKEGNVICAYDFGNVTGMSDFTKTRLLLKILV